MQNKPTSYKDNFGSINSSKLLPTYENKNGFVSLFTELDTHIKIGDMVFISASGTSVFDNFTAYYNQDSFPFSKYVQGYNVIDVNVENNQITIDKYVSELVGNISLDNHYITKIKGEYGNIGSSNSITNVDSSMWKNINLQNAVVDQVIILEGSITGSTFKSKYDNLYISLKKDLSSTSGVLTTKNNYTFGYNYVHTSEFPLVITGSSANYFNIYNSDIENGNFYNCILHGNNNKITGGYFENCLVKNYTIFDGEFRYCIISGDCIWNGGTWNDIDNYSSNFLPDTWYGGNWMRGYFSNKTWENGTFNDGIFINSLWVDGRFNDGTFSSATWINGYFNDGLFIYSSWSGGTFNNGYFMMSFWKTGILNQGFISGSTIWSGGTFRNGNFDSSIWYTGNFYDGLFSNSIWYNGNFYGGTFSNSKWISGNFYQVQGKTSKEKSTFINSIWSGGTFHNGSFSNSTWYDGDFLRGTFENSSWYNGTWYNGTWTNSSSYGILNWKKGSFNSGSLDPASIVNWSGGSFNTGNFISRNLSSLTDYSKFDASYFGLGTNFNQIGRYTYKEFWSNSGLNWVSLPDNWSTINNGVSSGFTFGDVQGLDLSVGISGSSHLDYFLYQYISRLFFNFNTSNIPDTANILSAKIKLYYNSVVSSTPFKINIVKSYASDLFTATGTTDWTIAERPFKGDPNYSNYALSGSVLSTNDLKISGYTFNSNVDLDLDINSINKFGYTKLCILSQTEDWEFPTSIPSPSTYPQPSNRYVTFGIAGDAFDLDISYILSGNSIGFGIAPITNFSNITAITWSDPVYSYFNPVNEFIILSANTNLSNTIKNYDKITLYYISQYSSSSSGITSKYTNNDGTYNYYTINLPKIYVDAGYPYYNNFDSLDYRDILSFNISSIYFNNKEVNITSVYSDNDNYYFVWRDLNTYTNNIAVTNITINYKNRYFPFGYWDFGSEIVDISYMDFKIVDSSVKYISGETLYDGSLFVGAYGGKDYTSVKIDKYFLWMQVGAVYDYPAPISDYLIKTDSFKWYDGNFYNNNFEAYWYGGYFENGVWNGSNKVTNTYDQPPTSGSNKPPKITNFKQI